MQKTLYVIRAKKAIGGGHDLAASDEVLVQQAAEAIREHRGGAKGPMVIVHGFSRNEIATSNVVEKFFPGADTRVAPCITDEGPSREYQNTVLLVASCYHDAVVVVCGNDEMHAQLGPAVTAKFPFFTDDPEHLELGEVAVTQFS